MNFREDETTIILMVLFSSIITGLMGYLIGYSVMQQNAVDNNAATWTVDKKCHVDFVWNNK